VWTVSLVGFVVEDSDKWHDDCIDCEVLGFLSGAVEVSVVLVCGTL
jgi:hypothetical protein